MDCNTIQKWAFRPTNLQANNPSDHWTLDYWTFGISMRRPSKPRTCRKSMMNRSIPHRLHCYWWDDCLT